MVTKTFSVGGLALPATEEGQKVQFRLRVGYAWKALTGKFRTVGPIDISHVEDEGYMEGRFRAYLTKGEVKRYLGA